MENGKDLGGRGDEAEGEGGRKRREGLREDGGREGGVKPRAT